MVKVRIRDKVGIKALVWAVMLAPCWGYTWAWAMLEIQASMRAQLDSLHVPLATLSTEMASMSKSTSEKVRFSVRFCASEAGCV